MRRLELKTIVRSSGTNDGSVQTEDISIDGRELQELIVNKWQRRYEVRLTKRGGHMSLEVMWKHLEQSSFHMTKDQYDE